MSSISRHHADWLSLLEISGPFLSMPVLLEAFPNGLDALDPELIHNLRSAYEEWAENQGGTKADPAIHTAWIRYVLEQALEYNGGRLLAGQAIPVGIKAAFPEHDVILRPDMALVDPKTQKARLLIQVFSPAQELDRPPHGSRWQASLGTRMMELLHATDVRLGLVTNGEQWMLVDAPAGETTGFITWEAHLWFEERITLSAFISLLGLRRFFGVPDAETLEALLAKSAQNQQEVTEQLGYQVRSAVEILIRSLDKADQDRGRKLLADLNPDVLYEAALTVMMRLVFLMSAEERKLFPLDDLFYAQNYAVSTLRGHLREQADQSGEDVQGFHYDAWCRLLAAFRIVYSGLNHDRLHLPAYGGSLFDPDRFPFLEGRPAGTGWKNTPAHPLPVDNRTVLHLLEALQLLRVSVPGGGPAEARRLSFRALDIEQIGHVYEGLLDHKAVRAAEPTLGLVGAKYNEPEMPLSTLERYSAPQKAAGALPTCSPAVWVKKEILDFLHEKTNKSLASIEKALKAPPDAWQQQKLRLACGNSEALYQRILPFAGLVREDDYGNKIVIHAGSLFVTEGSTRRATGTHYTPRSLTEPIVQHTLEPLVYLGPAEGLPPEKWKLHAPKELLELKICDMAMGSGAFLVQACRYLSERLVEAWDETIRAQAAAGPDAPAEFLITAEGLAAPDLAKAIPMNDEDRRLLARRLVADRCLYGVDKNHLAVEMAKLSLWLVTLDKNRAFTFLDHALKCGDSLVGADEDMYRKWAYSLKGAQYTLYLSTLDEMLEAARQKRKELERFVVLDVRDAEHKARLLKEADDAMAHIKLGCNLLVGVRLLGLKAAEQEELLAHFLWDYVAGLPMISLAAQQALAAANKEHIFHWSFEFPEVFERGGFNSFIGNPPFLGGTKVSTIFGSGYLKYLQNNYPSFKGRADLCTLFFIRSFALLQTNGRFGLLATNSIIQGDSKVASIDYINTNGGEFTKVVPSQAWPGEATVFVSILLGTKRAKYAFSSNPPQLEPRIILANQLKSFTGSKLDGTGFILSIDEGLELIKENNIYREVILPFLDGQDVNTDPAQQASRLIIFFSDWNREKAESYQIPFRIVKERVYPGRQNHSEKRARDYWWQFQRIRSDLYSAISNSGGALVQCIHTKYLTPVFVNPNQIFSHALIIFPSGEFELFSLLQSNIHEAWARSRSGTIGNNLRYTPSDCFETFPFPHDLSSLQQIGNLYHETRGQIMQSRNEGLTTLYNLFHDSEENSAEIVKLRNIHQELDYKVSSAYGWDDLNLEHNFRETPQGIRFTISEAARREVLRRLLQLNHERWEEEEKAGLHEKKGKKKEEQDLLRPSLRKPRQLKNQPGLYAEEEIAPQPAPASPAAEEKPVPAGQIGSWDQLVCLGCGKHLMGFSVEEHTKKAHGGKDPGYRKVK